MEFSGQLQTRLESCVSTIFFTSPSLAASLMDDPTPKAVPVSSFDAILSFSSSSSRSHSESVMDEAMTWMLFDRWYVVDVVLSYWCLGSRRRSRGRLSTRSQRHTKDTQFDGLYKGHFDVRGCQLARNVCHCMLHMSGDIWLMQQWYAAFCTCEVCVVSVRLHCSTLQVYIP